MSTEIFLTKRYKLPALHQLGSPRYSAEKNLHTFGACSRLHGHEYELEVTVWGKVDPITGILMSRDELDRVVRCHVIEPFTGRNLSNYFSLTTGEALALEFFELLHKRLPPHLVLSRLTVNETAKNSFAVDGR